MYTSNHALRPHLLGLLCCHGTKILLKEKDGRNFNYQKYFPDISSNTFDVLLGIPVSQAAASQLRPLHQDYCLTLTRRAISLERTQKQVVRWELQEGISIHSGCQSVGRCLDISSGPGPNAPNSYHWEDLGQRISLWFQFLTQPKRRNLSPRKAGICLMMHH